MEEVVRSQLASILRQLADRLQVPAQSDLALPFAPLRERKPATFLKPVPTDLLGRAVVNLDTPELQRFLAGKRILVTGAGGSIGSEICRQAMRFCPERVLLVERSENALFEIDRELREAWIGADIRPFVADVTEPGRMSQIFRDERPQVVFHCAAHKHVPMMEVNPCEAIKNNVFGTQVTADAALEFGVQAFVLVSTDKAVNPTSIMGASKRVAEMVVQAHGAVVAQEMHGNDDKTLVSLSPRASVPASIPSTRFTTVRFGNVLGSSGSVVPIFQRQIEAGGPVTVTHPEMRRFFMTIPEASQLVMQAGAIGRGGEVMVLDMGSPVRILDLAKEMIRRQGLIEDQDIQIRFSGVRPGEKLNEELAGPNDQTMPTSHEKIRVWQLPQVTAEQVAEMLDVLADSVESPARAIAALRACVPEFLSATVGPMSLVPRETKSAIVAAA